MKEVLRMTVEKVMDQWHLSNNLFEPPVTVTNSPLVKRLEVAWDKFGLIARGKAKKDVKAQWEPKLDKLFDVTVCQCPITICPSDTSTCKQQCGGHIDCTCPREAKLPVQELAWLHSQRMKEGDYSTMFIGVEDKKETERQIKYQERKKLDAAIPENHMRRRNR